MAGDRVTPSILLFLIVLQAQLTWEQRPTHARPETRKRFSQRLRRLDEQFRTFQEITLAQLQSIRESYNSVDARFHAVMQRFDSIAAELSYIRVAAQQNFSTFKSWSRKLQNKAGRLERKLAGAERSIRGNAQLARRQLQEHKAALNNLTGEFRAQRSRLRALEIQRDAVRHLQNSLREHQTQISELEGQVRTFQRPPLNPGNVDLIGTPPPSMNRHQDLSHGTKKKPKPEDPKDDGVGNRLAPQPGALESPSPSTEDRAQTSIQTITLPTAPPEEDTQIQSLLRLPLRHKIPQNYTPKKTATICNVNSMLLFPSTSPKNYVTFLTPLLTSVHELSICTWLKVDGQYVGTLLSYATADNDNTLVLYGRRSSSHGGVDFVIGDPAYRELTVGTILDGKWHHMCVIWSSIEGRFWHYVDRRLVSTGSNFQKGYEIPPGGSMILGQEQDSVGGGFDEAEAFVGRLAGFAMWSRTLSPGEVTGLASGKGIPRGALLNLDDVDALHGSVQQVTCECLEYCP